MKEKIRELMQSAVKSLEAAQEDVREAMELEQEAYGEEGSDELPILDDVLDDIEDRVVSRIFRFFSSTPNRSG